MAEQVRLTKEILRALREPFAAQLISWKPQRVNGNRALAVAYIDARDVMNRLDDVVAGDWEYYWSADGQDVHGSLTVCGATREDVGEIGSGPMGATRKAAVSDALKRCGVHFGIARYLYQLPAVWVDYDERTKRIVEPLQLPSWALPHGKPEPTVNGMRDEDDDGVLTTEGWATWSDKAHKAFWAKANDLGLDGDAIHREFSVASMKDYAGSMDNAADVLSLLGYVVVDQGLTLDDLHNALGVDAACEYKGNPGVGKAALDAYIARMAGSVEDIEPGDEGEDLF